MIVKSPWPSIMPVPEVSLCDIIEDTAYKYPEKEVIWFVDGRSYKFKEVVENINGFAKALLSINISKGDVVAIHLPNCPEYIFAFHGILKAGATVTTLNPLYKEEEIAYQLKDSKAKAIVTWHQLLPVVKKAIESTDVETIITVGEAAEGINFWDFIKKAKDKNTEKASFPQISPKEDIAVLPYSSGTTGLPKGVMLTHYNLVSNVKQTAGTGEMDFNDTILAFLPFFHIYGMTVLMNVALYVGARLVIMPKFELELFLSLIEKHKVTKTYIVPPVALAMTQYKELKKRDLSSLISITSAAAPLPMEVAYKLQELLPHVIVKQGYGMTEASPVVTLNPLDKSKVKLESVGPPIPDTMIKIVSVEDPSKTLPINEVGELAIKGPQIMKGYLNKPEETSAVLMEDGWYLSGDIAKIDEDGYVYILDRKKEMIKYKGWQIAPAELESVLLSHPDIIDAAVVPKPHPEAGEIPKAYVVLRKNAKISEEEIMLFVENKVASYKKIREVEFVSEIPKSATGKILRKILIEREKSKN